MGLGLRMSVCLLAITMGAGCATRGSQSASIEPPGLVLSHDEAFRVTVGASDADDSEDFAEDYADEIARLIDGELLGAGFRVDTAGTGLHAVIAWIAPGGAWGEEAECHLEIRISRGAQNWRYKVVGFSGSTWGRDRIPTALAQAAAATVAQLETVRE